MKKLISLLLVLVLSLSTVVALVACSGTTELSATEEALALAADMTLEELEAAALEEIGSDTFIYSSVTSSADAAATAFSEKYGITIEKSAVTGDAEQYTALDASVLGSSSSSYLADVMIVQDTSELMLRANSGYLLNFIPNGLTVAEEDSEPLGWIYATKTFAYTKADADDDAILSNVWQMTGVDGKTLSGIESFSLQNPATESVNMSWLVMLTAEEYTADLESAYYSYFGTEWSASDEYANYNSVSYYFISQLIGNVSTWHSSDTTVAKNMAYYLQDATYSGGISYGNVGWVPYGKVKDILKILVDEDAALLNNYEFAGNTSSVEGFSAYAYKTYIQVPSNAQYPYTAALFVTYMTGEEAITTSIGSLYGYYSVTTDVEAADGKNLSEWSNVVYEDGTYVYDNVTDVSKFVYACIASTI